jgi:hypothetical protein
MKTILPFLLLTAPAVLAGSFSGAAGTPGSEAISKDSTAFVAWANGHLNLSYGQDVESVWRTPQKAYGPALGTDFDIVCLGNGGQIVMTFPRPIRDGSGPDFAVFENAVTHTFLELAYVEVSSDGENFYRFPNRSLGNSFVGSYGMVDPTNLNGLAGKYQKGFGTPFDLSSLTNTPLLDRTNVRFVRIVDIIGDGSRLDSTGHPIYDPNPTIGSGGFDLEAIGVIHQNESFKILRAERADGAFQLAWESNPGSSYQVETSINLTKWTPLGLVNASSTSGITTQSLPLDAAPSRFWRVLRLDP